MKVKAKISGFDGTKSFAPGDDLAGDGEYLRSLLANSLADPIDEAAKAFVADKALMERHSQPELSAVTASSPKKPTTAKQGGK